MRFAKAALAALGLLAGCGSGPTEEEENLSSRAEHPEVTANSAAAPQTGSGNPSSATGGQASDPERPGGPVGVEGSQGGTGQ